MDHVFGTAVEPFVPAEGGWFRDIEISSIVVIELSFQVRYKKCDAATDDWHHHINHHGYFDLETDVNVPHWYVIIVRAIEWIVNFFWEMLWQVGIHKEDDETGVRELSHEDTTGRRCLLRTRSWLSNVIDHVHDSILQDNVE